MNTKFNRETLLAELEEMLERAGPHPRRWPARCCARLSAFIEYDKEASRLFAEAKALEKVLCCAPSGASLAKLESCILSAAAGLPQQRRFPAGFEVKLGGRAIGRNGLQRIGLRIPPRSLWGEAAVLAASLAIGLYIGMSGEAVPTLRELDVMSSQDGHAGLAFSGSLFEPSGLHHQEPL
jgi:hypothetical protein